jgi:large subunit ribosomal protein L5
MYDFLDKLFNVCLPRVRDFRGISDKIFDGRANCTIGMKEHIIFPEIDYDKIDKVKGLNISIVTTAKTDAEGRYLLELLGMPFRS